MHSSGMRTARLLTVSLHALWWGCTCQGGVPAWAGVPTGGTCPGACTCLGVYLSWGVYLPRGCTCLGVSPPHLELAHPSLGNPGSTTALVFDTVAITLEKRYNDCDNVVDNPWLVGYIKIDLDLGRQKLVTDSQTVIVSASG